MKTYRNERLGFQIDVPAEWNHRLIELTGTGCLQRSRPSLAMPAFERSDHSQ